MTGNAVTLESASAAGPSPHAYTDSSDWITFNVQDIIRVRRAEGSLRDVVADHMTSPAMTVGPKVPVRRAAETMLKHKIRRLPVVDGAGRAIG